MASIPPAVEGLMEDLRGLAGDLNRWASNTTTRGKIKRKVPYDRYRLAADTIYKALDEYLAEVTQLGVETSIEAPASTQVVDFTKVTDRHECPRCGVNRDHITEQCTHPWHATKIVALNEVMKPYGIVLDPNNVIGPPRPGDVVTLHPSEGLKIHRGAKELVLSIRKLKYPNANPIGMEHGMSEHMKSEADQAIAAILDIMNDKEADKGLRFDAARFILQRAEGSDSNKDEDKGDTDGTQ